MEKALPATDLAGPRKMECELDSECSRGNEDQIAREEDNLLKEIVGKGRN
jgi:hypothetical protein